MDSEFQAWYESQYGKRPSKLPLMALQEQLVAAESAAIRARHLFDSTVTWERQRAVARKGWCAARTEKAGE
jgi:hypothetical protein